MNIRHFLFLIVALPLINACGGSSSDSPPPDPTPVAPVDSVAPVIELIGETTITITLGDSFEDPGATATDNVDGSVSVSAQVPSLDALGNFDVIYTAIDAAGNQAIVSRTIIVQAAPDTQAPVISLLGNSIIRLEQGQAYEELGASAIDDIDGEVQVTSSGSVGQAIGIYTIIYSAQDQAGNTATVTRTVNIVNASPTSDGRQNVLIDNQIDVVWNNGAQAFDQALNFSNCNNTSVPCASIEWQTVSDSERGDVLQISHTNGSQIAGFFLSSSTGQNLSEFAQGSINFDIKVLSGNSEITFKLDCVFPCTSNDVLLGAQTSNEWVNISYPMASLISSGLDITKVDTGIVIWASQGIDTVFLLDNVFFSTQAGEEVIPEAPVFTNFTSLAFGAGSVSDTINPNSYKCVFDFGNWIYNAGLVEPGVAGCDTASETPIGSPTKLFPHVSAPASNQPVASGRWWGSLSFMGEMQIGDANNAAYITPDPITARLTNKGVRMMGIPSGMKVLGNDFLYPIPDPFSEVFDGIAIANSQFDNLDATLKNHSDGSVTAVWHSGQTEVMQATFVHGSAHVFFEVFSGDLLIRTLRSDGGEKGIFYEQNAALGVWTSVAGNTNHFLVNGDDSTVFSDTSSNEIGISSNSNKYTVTLLPTTQAPPSDNMISDFLTSAQNQIASVTIDYQVNHENNTVTVTHSYLDENNQAVTTLAGMQPLHWKNANDVQMSAYSVRSARGITQYANTSSFSYTIDFVGVLPALPNVSAQLDSVLATALVNEFVDQGAASFNNRVDAYWSGKNYGKVAELIGLADQLNLVAQRDTLLAWLKSELSDWFTASNEGNLDEEKYFAYDSDWNTLLAMEESFASHQQLNDHHFHYGYLVRAAAEVCRFDIAWCSSEQYGPMIELLIRDYAAGRNDEMFPYLRHFDPANGFSWASGKVNFVRGNNNESTSEAANAYGAIILYGMLTNNQELIDRGIYLHASTSAAYWEYWNNIDGYSGNDSSLNNFPAEYSRITTSIIWGDGAVFSTWFSGAFAHILGIQGLPMNTLSLHIGQYSDYLADYVSLGLSESSNNLPSGLIDDQWRDIWWKIWAMTKADQAFADYSSVSDYEPEAGETKAHTYYWLKQWQTLGQMQTGDGSVTADYPAAMMFQNGEQKRYVVYNFGSETINVTFSDGTSVEALPMDFTVVLQ